MRPPGPANAWPAHSRPPRGWAASTLGGGVGRGGDSHPGLPRIPVSPEERSARSHPSHWQWLTPGKVRRSGVLLFLLGSFTWILGSGQGAPSQPFCPRRSHPDRQPRPLAPHYSCLTRVLQLRGGHPPHPCWGSCQPLRRQPEGPGRVVSRCLSLVSGSSPLRGGPVTAQGSPSWRPVQGLCHRRPWG